MEKEKNTPSQKQQVFRDMVFGIFVYSVVLGFFEQYTDILHTWSYTFTFFAAVVLQILTYLTIWIESHVAHYFKDKEGKKYKAILVFCVGGILFISKFVFLLVIDMIFGEAVTISGFIGLLCIIIIMSLVKALIDKAYKRLA